MAKVSIIIPIYNAEKYLDESLSCIKNQTYKDIEVICIDDGSTDNTNIILDRYVKKDVRFKVYKQKNRGAASARNMGLRIARGDYILFLDCDDIFADTLVEKCVYKADKFMADIVIYKAVSFDTRTHRKTMLNDAINKYKKYCNSTFSINELPDNIFNSFLVQAWNKFYRKEFIMKNNLAFQNIKRSNDLYFSQMSLVLAERIILIDEYLLSYRVGMTNNLQSKNYETPFEFYKALLKLKLELEKLNLLRFTNRSFLKLAIDIIFYNLNSIRSRDLRKQFIIKLKKEIFLNLGITGYSNLKEVSYLGALQCNLVLKNANDFLFIMIYNMYKLHQYYRLYGSYETIGKVFNKF